MRVLKFGGRALGDGPALLGASDLVRRHGGQRPVVVVSAHHGVTQLLRRAATEPDWLPLWDDVRVRHRTLLRQLGLSSELLDRHLKELKGVLTELRPTAAAPALDVRRRDFVLSFGERMSARVFATVLRREGVPAAPIDAFDLGLVLQAGRAPRTLDPRCAEPVRRALAAVSSVPVVTGFLALDEDGFVATLGPDGSDLTAIWIGAAVGAHEVQLWKCVPGLMSADPARVPAARLLPSVDHRTAARLARAGAAVLHPAAIEPAAAIGLPVHLRDVSAPLEVGTMIQTTAGVSGAPGANAALAHRTGLARLRIDFEPGASATQEFAEALRLLSEYDVSVCHAGLGDGVAQLVVDSEAFAAAPERALASKLRASLRIERGWASLTALTGDATADARVQAIARQQGIDLSATPGALPEQAGTFLLREERLDELLRAVHAVLVEEVPVRSLLSHPAPRHSTGLDAEAVRASR